MLPLLVILINIKRKYWQRLREQCNYVDYNLSVTEKTTQYLITCLASWYGDKTLQNYFLTKYVVYKSSKKQIKVLY